MATKQELLAKVKASIRISHNALDEDVQDTIEACLADLQVCGVQESKVAIDRELDPLILNAVKLYCKAEYTDDPAKAARYVAGYDKLKACLMMAEGYGHEEAVADE
jgi:uncharacterized phage protein (predicted DNA packaging)